jgi:hypothetical protein
MRVLLLALVVLFSGCFAMIEEEPTQTKVKTFIIQDDNALDILEQAEGTQSDEKYEIQVFKVRKGD